MERQGFKGAIFEEAMWASGKEFQAEGIVHAKVLGYDQCGDTWGEAAGPGPGFAPEMDDSHGRVRSRG